MGVTTRLVLTNTVVLVGGFVALALTPATLSYPPTTREWLTLALLVAGLVAVEGWVISRVLAPLRNVRDAMQQVDEPEDSLPVLSARDDEIGEVATAFEEMLDRFSAERRETRRRALQAQEEERYRVARELHDEVGQDLAVLMLDAVAARDGSDPTTAERLDCLVEGMRDIIDEVRGISARLRPGALEDLGLEGAVRALVNDLQRQGATRIHLTWDGHPVLDAEQELVVYRVAQEALTNVIRHAQAGHAWVGLLAEHSRLVLTVADNGCGVTADPNTGIVGMRERARLVRGHLELCARDGGGTIARLTMPLTRTGQ